MKKTFSTIFFLLTLLFSNNYFSEEVISNHDYCPDNRLDEKEPTSEKIFVCHFLTNINQETAAKIDAFIMHRLGVVSSNTNISTKEISVVVSEKLDKNDVDFIFRTVKIKFLGPEDAPPPVVLEH